MEIDCTAVLRALSRYLEEEVNADLRAAMRSHISKCRHCSAVLDGTRNVVRLIADERSFEVPAGFGARLFRRLAREQRKD